MTVNRPPSATGEAFQTLREITLPSRPNAAAPPPIGAMRLAKTAMLAAGALAAAMPASAETTTEPACCLEVAEDAAGAGTFLVNVTVRTNEAKRNQNRLPTVVVFDDALDVSDDLTMRPFGVVDCTRRKQAPPGTTGNNASHNYFECTSQYSDFFFAQVRSRLAGPVSLVSLT